MADLPAPVLIDAAIRLGGLACILAGAIGLLLVLHRGDWRFVLIVVAGAAGAVIGGAAHG